MTNAADQRQVKTAGKRERLHRKRELADLAAVLATKPGRRFIWKILEQAGVFRVSFRYGEPETTVFNEGRRSMGLWLMADIHELDPLLYVTMAKEASEDEQTQEPEPATDTKPTTDEEERDHAP